MTLIGAACLTCSSDRTSSRLLATIRVPSLLAFAEQFSVVRLLLFCAVLGESDASMVLNFSWTIYCKCAAVELVSALDADKHRHSFIDHAWSLIRFGRWVC